jgi:hypothetical protein
MAYNRIGTDNYTIRPTDRFRWLRSSTRYEQADIASLLADPAISDLVPAGADPEYKADFLMPSTSDEYLYLIWDYSTGAAPPPEEFLLDTYTGAAAGYSTRRLASSATVLMRVRRETAGGTGDDDEADVAYDSNNELSLDSAISNASAGVTATTLGQFLNVGTVNGTTYTNPDSLTVTASCFVDEWKDQSGNANHAQQSTQGNQPKIHSGTVNTDLITENGKPALNFDKSNDQNLRLASTSYLTNTNDMGFFAVCKSSTSPNSFTCAATISNLNTYYVILANNTAQVAYHGVTNSGSGNSDHNLFSVYADNASSDVKGYLNGSQVITTTPVSQTAQQDLFIGRLGTLASTGWDGTVQETIVWNTSTKSNQTAIEENINTNYLIYQPTDQPTSGLLYDYGSATGGTDASAAYSVRQLSDKAVICMRIRRDSDDEERNIGFDANGDLDTTAISDFCDTANGYVTRWWDQSVNGNHADQPVGGTGSNALQPQIYNGTAVITENGKPLLDASGAGFEVNFNAVQPFTVVSVGQVGNTNAHQYSDVTRSYNMRPFSTAMQGRSGQLLSTPSTYVHSGQMFAAYIADSFSSYVKATSSAGSESQSGNSGSVDFTVVTIMNRNVYDRPYSTQELIFWNVDQGTTNVAAIEADMDTYYSFS